MDDPSMMPDLSHLSAEEREIIEQVFKRQRAEEEKETEVAAKAETELEEIDRVLNERKTNAQRLVGTQDDAICQICQKTKFADGIGHKCFYCQLRSCARCGGRSQSKGKPIWACSLCQKKQSILAKTGKWFHPDDAGRKGSGAGLGSPCQSTSPVPSTPTTQQPPPQQPMPMKGNGHPPNQQPLPRQMSNANGQAPPGQQRQMQNGPPHDQRGNNGQPPGADVRRQNSLRRQPSLESEQYRQQSNGSVPQQRSTGANAPTSGQPNQQAQTQQRRQNDTRLLQGLNVNDNMRTRSQSTAAPPNGNVVHEDERRKSMAPHTGRSNNDNRPIFYTDDRSQDSSRLDERRLSAVSPSSRRCSIVIESDERRNEQQRERRPSQSRPGVHSANAHQRRPSEQHQQQKQRNGPVDQHCYEDDYKGPFSTQQPEQSLHEQCAAEFRRSNHPSGRADEEHRATTSGVAPAVNAVPPSPDVTSNVVAKTNVSRQRSARLNRQSHSMPSSEEEEHHPSTSDGFRGEDAVQRLPNECTSEKGQHLLRYIYGGEKIKNGRKSASGALVMAKYRSDDNLSRSPARSGNVSNVMPGDVLSSSKIRTFLSQPVTWQASADNRRMIGHMKLHRTDSIANGDLGLKVMGGRLLEHGRLAAFVVQVKPGSVADTIGKLRAGDEVLEWNGHPLQNASSDQVKEIINASKHDTQVELIVSRGIGISAVDDALNVYVGSGGVRQLPNLQQIISQDNEIYQSPSASPSVPPHALSHSQSAFLPSQMISPRRFDIRQVRQADEAFPDLGPPVIESGYGKGLIFGRIEISVLYSHHDKLLTVTIERAIDLPPRPDGMPRNPYAKVFLLPGRSEQSRRQTTILAETLVPIWSESFFYQGLTEPAMLERILEVTVWDYDKYDANSFLGETLIDLSAIPLDGQPFLYTLVDMDEENPLRMRLRYRKTANYGAPQRPRSEMGYGRTERMNRYSGYERDYDEPPPIHRLQMESAAMRRSRTYDRGGIGAHGRYTPVHAVDDDWHMNGQAQSGYQSDHGYRNGPQTMRSRRRPRSATAVRPMTNAEMSASRMYSRNIPGQGWDEGEIPDSARNRYAQPQMGIPASAHGRYPSNAPPRSPNGRRVMMEAMQEQQGYGSDGSETMSIHSAHSMPVVRTINRRAQIPNGRNDVMAPQENSMEEYAAEDNVPPVMGNEHNGKMQNVSAANMAAMKERKKSLMTRFIPGRGANGQGQTKRTGFARSEEVGIPENLSSDRLQPPFLKQASKESNDSTQSDNWLPVLPDGPLGAFVENLGPGQVVGRQVLASPLLGEIQLGIMAGRAGIDVEIIRARNLAVKPGVKINPANVLGNQWVADHSQMPRMAVPHLGAAKSSIQPPYVKVYLMAGKQCIAKAKTNAVRKTTSPLFQQHLIFTDSPKGKMLQITVLGDYGRMERKVFMGIAQIRLDELELGPEPLIGWYKLFHSSSLAGTGPLRKDSETSLSGLPQ